MTTPFPFPIGTKRALGYQNQSPEERQRELEDAAAMIGGTVGSMIPIPGAGIAGRFVGPLVKAGVKAAWPAVMAGLGSAVGKYGARELGPAPPRTTPGDVLQTMLLNAVAQKAGESLPNALAYLGGLAKQKLISPSQTVEAFATALQSAGIPINLTTAIGKQWVMRAELFLRRRASAAGVMQKNLDKQVEGWNKVLQSKLDALSADKISPEEFVRQASAHVQQGQNLFSQGVAKQVEATAGKFAPTPQSPIEAGAALKKGIQANWNRMRDWAESVYGPIRQAAGDTPISLAPMKSYADELNKEFANNADLQKLMSGKAKAVLSALSVSKQTVGKAAAPIGEGVLDSPEPTQTLTQLLSLRSELLHASRNIPPGSAASVPTSIHEALNAVNDTIDIAVDNALPGTALHEVGPLLKDANAKYRKLSEALKPPAQQSLDAKGNVTVGQISTAKYPEDIVGRILQPGAVTRIQEAERAVSPSTVSDITGISIPNLPSGSPMDPLRRSYIDILARESAVEAPTFKALPIQPSSRRISPKEFAGELERMTPPTTEALLGQPPAAELAQTASSTAQIQENLLYGNDLVKALQKGKPEQVINAGYPPEQPFQIPHTEALLGPGLIPAGRRQYVEQLMEKSRTPMVSRAEPMVSPVQLNEQMRRAGETLPAAIGTSGTVDLGQTANMGEHLFAPQIEFGHFSPASASDIPINTGMAQFIPTFGVPAAAAKLHTGEWGNLPEWALKPPVFQASTGSRILGGIAGRALGPKLQSDLGPTAGMASSEEQADYLPLPELEQKKKKSGEEDVEYFPLP